MIRKQKCIVIDVDGTLCPVRTEKESYSELQPYPEMLAQLRSYRERGFYIIIYSSRNMNTHDGNMGKIIAETGKQMMQWLERHDIPFDEMHLGKPWPGHGGFYVDDRTIRPDEFQRLSYDQIMTLLGDTSAGD